jgi:ribose 1,5-bisphosphokinase
MDGASHPGAPVRPGTLIAVVGPSGVGKDSLIAGARAAFEASSGVVFARRLITRPADEAGENHLPVSVADFDRLQASGAFAVSWEAHGLRYGVPAAVLDDLAAGRIVVVNGSRSALDRFQAVFPRLLVVNVTARPEVLGARLAARGRENKDEIAARLERAVDPLPENFDVVAIDNSGPLDEGVQKLVSLLKHGQSEVA